MQAEPEWLRQVRELQAIAQTGLAFTRDPYDRDRYEALRSLAAAMLADRVGADAAGLRDLFANERGYATPKVDVRGAVFDDSHRLLMVRETADSGRWTLPGGWADVNQTASECVLREIREESGYEARIVKLALLHDRARQGHQPVELHSIYKLFFLCALTGGEARGSLETSEVRFFAEPEVPADLSTGRTLPHQIARLFAHHRDPALATEFD
nr:NUDIX hydrolase [uncultured Lichenicoccus sp.]